MRVPSATILALGLCVLTASAAHVQARAGDVAPLSLAQLEAMALDRHPALKQAASSVAAAQGRAEQAGAWSNPTIGYFLEEATPGEVFRFGEHGMFYEQRIPLGGKLAIGREVLLGERSEAEAEQAAQRQRVLGEVRARFVEVLAATARADVDAKLAELATEAVEITRQLFNVGAADRPDVLDAEIEERRAAIALIESRNKRVSAWRALAVAVGDPALPVAPLAARLDEVPADLQEETSRRMILEGSPELSRARAAVSRAEASLKRSQRETSPDLFVRVAPNYNRQLLERSPGGDAVTVGWELAGEIGVSIPLFNRNQGSNAAATAEIASARGEVTRLELSLAGRFAGVFESYQSSREAAEVFTRDVLPRAEEAYELHLARYREMAASYPQVLVARRTLAQVTRDRIDALERAWRSAEEIRGFLVDRAQ